MSKQRWAHNRQSLLRQTVDKNAIYWIFVIQKEKCDQIQNFP